MVFDFYFDGVTVKTGYTTTKCIYYSYESDLDLAETSMVHLCKKR